MKKYFRFFPLPNEFTFKESKESEMRFKISKSTKFTFSKLRAVKRVLRKIEEVIQQHHDVVEYENEIILQVKNPEAELQYGVDESYSLICEDAEKMVITSETVYGLKCGLWTLFWLIVHNKGEIPCGLEINDSPLYSWRGVLIDVTRHFIPMEMLKRIVLILRSLKFNVIHLHLCDDQHYRLESHSFPELTKDEEQFFTIVEMKNFVEYCSQLGVRVIPEIDIPGHCSEIIRKIPHLASFSVPSERIKGFGIFNGVLNPISTSTFEFLEKLLTEICDIFPDRFLHLGGDEIDPSEWVKNEEIKKYKFSNNLTNRKLHLEFAKKVYSLVEKISSPTCKKIIFWDEVMDEDLAREYEGRIFFQRWRWRSKVSGYENLIFSNGFYLDHLDPAELYYTRKNMSNIEKESDSSIQRILGGEACCWTEFITEENIESRLFPVSACIAERFWTKEEFCKDVDFMYDRLYTSFEDLLEPLFGSKFHNRSPIHRLCPSEPEKFCLSLLEASWGGFNKDHERATPKFTTDHSFTEPIDYCRSESRKSWELFKMTNEYVKNRRIPNIGEEKSNQLKKFFEQIFELEGVDEIHPHILEIYNKRLKRCSEIALVCLQKKKAKGFKKKEVLKELNLMETNFVHSFYIPIIASIRILVQAYFDKNYRGTEKFKRINKIFPKGRKKK